MSLDNRWEAASVSSAGLRRRPACVLSLDVVGYSRMMARNDMVAVVALGDCRAVIEGESRNHQGRILGVAGDGFMLELPDAAASVRCAFAIQKRVFARNKGAGEEAHIWLRAGIAIGSVIDDAGNLFGDVVNVAARLQETCPSGGPGKSVKRLPAAFGSGGQANSGSSIFQLRLNCSSRSKMTSRLVLSPMASGSISGSTCPGSKALACSQCCRSGMIQATCPSNP